MCDMTEKQKLTIPDLAAKKAAGERLVMVAVGEAMTAAWARQFQQIGQNLTKLRYDNRWNRNFKTNRLVPSLSTI